MMPCESLYLYFKAKGLCFLCVINLHMQYSLLVVLLHGVLHVFCTLKNNYRSVGEPTYYQNYIHAGVLCDLWC